MSRSVLTVNSGSSSLKLSFFSRDGGRRDWRYGAVGDHPERAFDAMLRELDGEMPEAIGHRFVHGGEAASPARALNDAELERLHGLVPLAPLHLPGNLSGAVWCAEHFDVPQVACFDTAFHHTLPELARRLPIPSHLGLRRYGFHGLNYQHVASQLPGLLGDQAQGRVVVAHLGSGASLCLLERLRSVDTTMGWSPAGGIPMATRSGDLDPGVMLELASRYDADALGDLVYRRMGLLALSEGESSDMAALLASGSDAAKFAVDYFCREVSGAVSQMAGKAGGIDALVFTGGIGEHAPAVRAGICQRLAFLGFALDDDANAENGSRLHAERSKPVLQIPADEEGVIRMLVESTLDRPVTP